MHDTLQSLKAENQHLTECLSETQKQLGLDPFLEQRKKIQDLDT